MILVTGSEGLIGRHVCALMRRAGVPHAPFDLRRSPLEDVRNPAALANALHGVRGVVHLAAVSRVIWGEQDPELCEAINVQAVQSLLRLCVEGARPWVIFASSREVYGQAESLPVREDDAKRPKNHYARSKLRGEQLAQEAGEAGLLANICRFSSVFGCPHDHADRVATAFAAAAAGRRDYISVEGPQNMLDFTSVRDAAEGLFRLIQATDAGERLPPIHFVTSQGTTLGDLAALAVQLSGRNLRVEDSSPRAYGVSRFVGDPARARSLLGWAATRDLRSEFARLVREIAALPA